jgi:hypothetical protein
MSRSLMNAMELSGYCLYQPAETLTHARTFRVRHDCHIPLDRQTFLQTSVAGSFSGTDFCLIFAPCEGYDEPEILPSSSLMSADGGH